MILDRRRKQLLRQIDRQQAFIRHIAKDCTLAEMLLAWNTLDALLVKLYVYIKRSWGDWR